MSSAPRVDEKGAPNCIVHPGEHVAEFLEARGWSQADFARLTDLSPKMISTILSGRNPVTPDTAIRFERVLGLKAHIWTGLQADWNLQQARASEVPTSDHRAWLADFPMAELKARNRLPDVSDEGILMDALLSLLGAATPRAFQAKAKALAVHHRQSKAFKSSPQHIQTWLALGETRARSDALPPFDREAFLSALRDIRALTLAEPSVFEPRMKALCRDAGVAVIFEQPISKTCLFGSARWFDTTRAIIQMSLRIKSNDHFWWTFFHEAGHIALHQGRTFADDKGGEGDGVEAEADAFAEEMLVGRERFAEFKTARPHSEIQVCAFAAERGVHPGIVVGLLQQARVVSVADLNTLKARFTWADEPIL